MTKLEYMKYLEDFVRNINSEHRAYMRALEEVKNLDNGHVYQSVSFIPLFFNG